MVLITILPLQHNNLYTLQPRVQADMQKCITRKKEQRKEWMEKKWKENIAWI